MRHVDLLRVDLLGWRGGTGVGEEGGKGCLGEVRLHLGVCDPHAGVLVSRYRPSHVNDIKLVVDPIDLLDHTASEELSTTSLS